MKKRGQVWVETVTYTLIAFVLIGMLLVFVQPKIQQMQDHSVIDQSLSMMKQIDSTVQEVAQAGVGNKREVQISLSAGSILFNSTDNSITFELDGSYMYSEPDQTYHDGNIIVTTIQKGNIYIVTLKKKFIDYNMTYNNQKIIKKILKTGTPYNLYITNNGNNVGEKNTIDFQLD